MLAALRQARRQRAHMGFELVAIGVEEVKRIAFAAIHLPRPGALRQGMRHKLRKIGLLNGERTVRVLRRRRCIAPRIPGQAQPHIPQRQIGTGIPLRMQAALQRLRVKRHAAGDIGDGKGEVVQSGQHEKISGGATQTGGRAGRPYLGRPACCSRSMKAREAAGTHGTGVVRNRTDVHQNARAIGIRGAVVGCREFQCFQAFAQARHAQAAIQIRVQRPPAVAPQPPKPAPGFATRLDRAPARSENSGSWDGQGRPCRSAVQRDCHPPPPGRPGHSPRRSGLWPGFIC